jgi:hypothetical protein
MSDRTPEYFSDVFDFTMNPYGVAIGFGLTELRQPPGAPSVATDQVVVRMSLEQAKILSMLLRRTLSTYEREHGVEIAIPSSVYSGLGVAREDWPSAQR